MEQTLKPRPNASPNGSESIWIGLLKDPLNMGLLNISFPWQIKAQEETAIISWRECSKKSVQQGRELLDRSRRG